MISENKEHKKYILNFRISYLQNSKGFLVYEEIRKLVMFDKI